MQRGSRAHARLHSHSPVLHDAARPAVNDFRWRKSSLPRSKQCNKVFASSHGFIETLGTSLKQFQGGAEGVGAFLESAPPPCYLIYLLAAGFGLPCSEDALVAWIGANITKGAYGSSHNTLITLMIVYVGVIASDMVTFGIGVLLKMGFFKSLKASLMRDSQNLDKALSMVKRWSTLIGLIQRFSLGFRGPLCLVCGFTGVSAKDFVAGVALGALGTMPVQLFVGYLLRGSPTPYLAALAIAAGPNLVGHVVGPLATAVGFWWAGRGRDGNSQTLQPNKA